MIEIYFMLKNSEMDLLDILKFINKNDFLTYKFQTQCLEFQNNYESLQEKD